MTGTKNKKHTLRKKVFKPKRWWVWLALIVVILVGFGLIFKDFPNPKKLSSFDYPESSQLFDRNGKLLFELFSERNRVSVKLSEIPESIKKATLAIEDVHFYSHAGFDIRGLLRGLYRTIFQKRLQGGSTLTQQLVKNALLTPERTITRKIKEAVLTVATELMYSKDQILEMYFNQTPYGGTMWGINSAARGIFNKNLDELTLAEAALLAGLPGSPTAYSPFAHPELAKKRQELVLTRMEELKMISTEEKEKAIAEKLNFYVNKSSIKAPHFVFYIKDQLIETYGAKRVTEGGLKVKTTLDLDMQNFVQTAVASETAKLNKLNVTNGAALVTEPKTGEILAMVGSKDYFADDIDGKYNVTTALRQPGSSIKPFNYAVALELGKATAASILSDQPTCFRVENQKAYCPTNYGNNYFGLQTLRSSLANSLNIPAVKILKLNGLETFVASASAFGISTYKDPSAYGWSLTLGGGEVHMTDMTVAFGVLANSGVRQNLRSISSVADRAGKEILTNSEVPGKRIISRETAYIIQDILSDDGARSMVFGRGSMLTIKGHPEVAVKTGTTNDMRDNWTIGFTPDFVTAVWVGNNDNSKMSRIVSGTTGAAPVWHKIMSYLLENKPSKKWTKPNELIGQNVCNLTGKLIPDDGCESHFENFKSEYSPQEKVSLHRSILIDKDTGLPVQPGEDKPNAEWQSHLAVEDVMGVLTCLDCAAVGGTTPATVTIR